MEQRKMVPAPQTAAGRLSPEIQRVLDSITESILVLAQMISNMDSNSIGGGYDYFSL